MVELRRVGTSTNVHELHIGNVIGVFSYAQLVAVEHLCQWFKTSEYYSKTTSKHINQCVPNDAVAVDSETLEKIFEDAVCGNCAVNAEYYRDI